MKPLQIVEPLYEYSWLYAAVEPTPGAAFWWEWPRLEAACFTGFLRQVGQPYADNLNIVLLAQASAHGALRVEVPENVSLGGCPPPAPSCIRWNAWGRA